MGMKGPRQLSRSLSETYARYETEPCDPSSSEKALKIGADLVRQIFRYFEFEFRVGGIHLDDSD
jgi:hypothetical protein